MAFLIPDNLRGRSEIPAGIHRVATALKNGLDDEATAWFEPLFDPTGEKPDFVVMLPDSGIVMLEVLDAPAVAILGTVRGGMRLVRDGQEVEVEQPLARAEAFADVLRGRIDVAKQLRGHDIRVASAAAFPNLDRAAADGRIRGLDPERCLFREDITAGASGETHQLERRLSRLLGAPTRIDGELEAVVRGLIQPNTVISPGLGGQRPLFGAGAEEDVLVVMDRKQEALAKRMGDGHRVVRGVAGSGKTLILVHRAKLFSELYPARKFLLTCYTRTLASELRALLEDFENVEVKTLDQLMGKAIRDAQLDDPGHRDETGDERARAALQALERGALPRYRAVFVDEAQDFGTDALRFAVSLADDRFTDVLLVADSAQKVFRRNFSWKDAGIQAQGRTVILRRNYRNTREILELAFSFLVPGDAAHEVDVLDLEDENVIVPPEAAMRVGPAPAVSICDPAELVVRAVKATSEFLEDRARPKSIAILCMSNGHAIEVERRLHVANMDFFFVSDPQKRENKDRLASAEEPIVLSTVYSAKGLEFPAAVLCCTPAEWQELEQLRHAIYVGMTRATERLVVLADSDHPLRPDLEAAASSNARLQVVSP